MNFYEEYRTMLDEHGLHERFLVDYIEKLALDNGYVHFSPIKQCNHGDKFIFKFREKFITLVKVGKSVSEGANVIVSHLDSPRLDVIVGEPLVEKPDGVFLKVVPYGGLIYQSWLDRPLALVGKVDTENGVVDINTRGEFDFVITSLLPHLDGRKEMANLKPETLAVRVGNNKKENILELLKERYGLVEEDLQLADLSFVPSDKVREIGFDKDLIAGYGHDDKSCAFAELKAFFDAKDSDRTQIAIFASYEETGSAQNTGCQSEFINDIFLEITGDIRLAREGIRNSYVISADVCAGYESTYANHFEDSAKTIVGHGVGIVPYLGRKGGNDSEFLFRNWIKRLAKENDIKYSIETTKVSEGGGGTVSTFFATKGRHVIDVGVPVLAMHSPQEIISKIDLEETYKLYKAFYENVVE